jgi:hypothetical protein
MLKTEGSVIPPVFEIKVVDFEGDTIANTSSTDNPNSIIF